MPAPQPRQHVVRAGRARSRGRSVRRRLPRRAPAAPARSRPECPPARAPAPGRAPRHPWPARRPAAAAGRPSSATPAPAASATPAGSEARPGCQDLGIGVEVAAAAPHRSAGRHRRVHEDRRRNRTACVAPARTGLTVRVQRRRLLDRDDGVGAGRQRRARRDPDRRAGLDAALGDAAGRHLAEDLEPARARLRPPRSCRPREPRSRPSRCCPRAAAPSAPARRSPSTRPRASRGRHRLDVERSADRRQDLLERLLDREQPVSHRRRGGHVGMPAVRAFAWIAATTPRRVRMPSNSEPCMTGSPSRPVLRSRSTAGQSSSSGASDWSAGGRDHDVGRARRRPRPARDPAQLRHADQAQQVVAADHGQRRRLAHAEVLRRERVERQVRRDRRQVAVHHRVDADPGEHLFQRRTALQGTRGIGEEPAADDEQHAVERIVLQRRRGFRGRRAGSRRGGR